MEQEPERRERLWKNRDHFISSLNSIGVSTGESETPIIPVIVGDPERALKASEKLFEYGVYATAIRPPTVPANAARIRTTVTSAHSYDDIDSALEIFSRMKQEGYL